MRLSWFFIALAAAASLLALHVWALTDFLYWRYRWFDTPVHLLGAFAVGAFVAALLNRYRPIMYLCIVVIVAVAWELFEFELGVTGVAVADYRWDTAHDLLNDALGAIAAYVLARLTLWRSVPRP